MNTQKPRDSLKSENSSCCCTRKVAVVSDSSAKFNARMDFSMRKLKIDGATCEGYVKSIEHTLQSIPGVVKAYMDLESGRHQSRVY